MKNFKTVLAGLTGAIMFTLSMPVTRAAAPVCDVIPLMARLPDLATVIPQQVQVVNPNSKEGKRELIRFSNGIANIGDGPWRMRPEFPLNDNSQPQLAIQELLDSAGNLVCEKVVSQFQFHPEHNHWHINGVAEFSVHVSKGGGPAGSGDIGGVYVNDRGQAVSLKTTFCLIDWIKLGGNSNSSKADGRTYFDCFGDYQGISVGWVDEYHQSIEGQQLDVTGAPPGLYYLLSTANAEATFIETNYANNSAWVAFQLSRDSNGNPKITIIGDSFAAEGLGVKPDYTTNR